MAGADYALRKHSRTQHAQAGKNSYGRDFAWFPIRPQSQFVPYAPSLPTIRTLKKFFYCFFATGRAVKQMSVGDGQNRRFASEFSRGFLNYKRTAKLLVALIFFSAFVSSAPAQAHVTLAWNPISNPLVAGYNIYYGRSSGVYTNKTVAGNVTSFTISNLVIGATYYFATTTYSAAGAESAMSGEVSYLVPAPPPVVQLQVTAARQFILTVSGLTNQLYTISASENLTAWTVIGTVTVGATGSTTFTDTNAASFSKRFYRVN